MSDTASTEAQKPAAQSIVTEQAVIPPVKKVDYAPGNVQEVTNTGRGRVKPCVLCNHLISVYDTSAGCQDPDRSYPECDRLETVEATHGTSGTVSETPVSNSTVADAVAKLEAAESELKEVPEKPVTTSFPATTEVEAPGHPFPGHGQSL